MYGRERDLGDGHVVVELVDAPLDGGRRFVKLLVDLVEGWKDAKIGFKLDSGELFNHLVWVDGVWLMATSHGELTRMASTLTELMDHQNLPWKESSLDVTSTCVEHLPSIRINSRHGELIAKPVERMVTLGHLLTRSGSSAEAAEYRLGKAAPASTP